MSHAASLPMSSWPVPRQVAAGLFAALCATALALLATYLSAVLFLLLNKADPRQAELSSIDHYWDLYADDLLLRRKLLFSIGASGFGLLIVLPGAAIAAARQRRPLHGDARFATPAEIARAGLLAEGATQSPGILIGRHRGRFLALPGQLSVMLSAPTRSGKGVGVVVPNLLNWPDSVVVLDIKGENYDITAGYRKSRGQSVYAFSPFEENARSHRWNPLTEIRTDAIHRVGDLLTIGQILFPTEGNTSSEAFFNDQARNLFLGIGLFLLETPDMPRTVGEMLRQASGKGHTFKDYFQAVITQRQRERKPLSDECTDALQRLLANSDNTLTSIVSTFNAPLTIFADAVVDAATSANDFRLADVRRRPMSIYVRIPPNRIANARPLLNLFFSQLVSVNTQELPERTPELKLQCLLIHDEFAAMGRVGAISSAAAFLAGYNLRLLTVVQAMSQLDSVYGEKDARTFATNHGLQILFAPREQRDADEYSAMLGHFTERATSRSRSRSFGQHGHNTVSRNDSDQRRALLLPQEFKDLGAERFVAVVENCKPILGEKIRYHRDPVFQARLLAPPEVKPMDMALYFATAQQRWRYAADELAEDETLDLGRLKEDYTEVVDPLVNAPVENMPALVNAFFIRTRVGEAESGGSIEQVDETDNDLASATTAAAWQDEAPTERHPCESSPSVLHSSSSPPAAPRPSRKRSTSRPGTPRTARSP